MKKLFFMLICFSTVLILSCGGSGTGGEACESNFDCKVGYVCSGGTCISANSADDGSGDGDNSELPDDENSSESGKNDHDGGSATDDSDNWVSPDEPITGNCEPGKKQKCEYQGPEGTEDVGPCKSAVRTCKEDGTWGKCEGEVTPVLENTNELCSNGIDDDCDGEVDNGIDNICKGGSVIPDDEEPDEEDDSDVAHCDTTCSTLVEVENNGCLPAMASESDAGLCNGQDDDCDGKIDEGCLCTPGTTQACFSGKPANRGIGTCHDGIQTCKSSPMRAAKGDWGESKCVDDILPTKDVCDNADNNCNGCVDEGLCCLPPIDCDFDIGTATPFKDKLIDGTQIYDFSHQFNDAATAKWEWTLTKGPCDIVLGTTSFTTKGAATVAGLSGDGTASTTVSGTGLSQFKVKFQLSGTYNLHLKVTRENGEIYECGWPLKVESTGLRVELCWDKTGSSAVGGRDIDLYLGKNGVTAGWRDKACYFSNCKGDPLSSEYNWSTTALGGWGYAETTNYSTIGNSDEPVSGMKNPRLDIDNRSTPGKPENINIDKPEENDTFRVLVHFWSASSAVVHPVVNVYCGGTRKATFGGSPNESGSGFDYDVTNFNSEDDSWKVTEIEWKGGYDSDTCDIRPKLDANGKYVVTDGVIPSPYNTDW